MRTPRFAMALANASVRSQRAAASTPSPPATIKVVMAPVGLMPRASISTPDELRTGPGFTARTLIDGAMPA